MNELDKLVAASTKPKLSQRMGEVSTLLVGVILMGHAMVHFYKNDGLGMVFVALGILILRDLDK